MKNDITFVCCIEYGSLEKQTLLMLKTFRKHAGVLKNSRILAVQARRGAKLHASTVETLKALSVELIIDYQVNPATWFNYANKIAAVRLAQDLANTDLVAWLDSDILVAGAPTELILEEDIEFAARAEFLPPSVRGNDTTHVPYWESICSLLGVEFSALPSLYIDHRDETIKMYFNSGVFVWRRASDFADLYYEAFVKVLKSRIAQHDGNFFTADQIILGPILIKSQLKWKHLSYQCHHMTFQGQIDGHIASPNMSASALIHYSKSLNPKYRSRFMDRLAQELPALHTLVASELESAEKTNSADKIRDMVAHIYRISRGLIWRLYGYEVNKVPKG